MAPPDDEKAEKIREDSEGPQRASVDGTSAENHPVPDRILADRYARGALVTQKEGPLGLRIIKRVPPGAV